ncbi:sulfurtransferase complex subunit TusC [Vibrio metschnikovii]|nr:sulfurtransferase complex subunit TusC [Vibrio metschnikovii]EKO3881273.1 sulfurtransferase complex subunit TusC [Vibrio metschnikovii]EKO3940487.1 sulfurtransferase complex subunit TusC [Vibrio metschnikovii]
MKKIAFVFHSPPHATSAGREGLDAVLSASAYSDDLAVFFVGEGVLQLVTGQDPSVILSRDYISAFKLLDLYDVEQRYICEQSLAEWGLTDEPLIIDALPIAPQTIGVMWQSFDHIVTF